MNVKEIEEMLWQSTLLQIHSFFLFQYYISLSDTGTELEERGRGQEKDLLAAFPIFLSLQWEARLQRISDIFINASKSIEMGRQIFPYNFNLITNRCPLIGYKL